MIVIKLKALALDNDVIKLITVESKRFFNTNKLVMSNSNSSMDSSKMSEDISSQIIEICNCNNVNARLEKIKVIVNDLLSRRLRDNKGASLAELGLNDDFYAACFYEVCVQASQLKPILLTRLDDLIGYAKRILEACSINSTYPQETSSSKRIKLESNEPQHQQLQHTQQNANGPINNNNNNNLMNLYTALAYHLQSSLSNNSNPANINKVSMSGFMNLEMQLKQNLKLQEELKLKLYGLTTSPASGTPPVKLLIEQTQLQLNDTIKKYNELLLITLTCSNGAAAAAGAGPANLVHQAVNAANEMNSNNNEGLLLSPALLSSLCSANNSINSFSMNSFAAKSNEKTSNDQISTTSSYN
jgi:hypothetical protein